eukprot:11720481-Heterocapsa_arctica.AAC.1
MHWSISLVFTSSTESRSTNSSRRSILGCPARGSGVSNIQGRPREQSFLSSEAVRTARRVPTRTSSLALGDRPLRPY